MSEKSVNPNGLALYNVLADRQGEVIAFPELANLAGVEAKTGFLTAAKKIAADRNKVIVKVEDGVEVTIKTITEYPSGYKVEGEKTSKVAGYKLQDKE